MHVAIIMDGNGRWAERRGQRRTAGHRAGARAVRRVVEAAVRSGVRVLTLYAFSSDNWSRPREEVDALMRLLKWYLQNEIKRCVDNGVRVNLIGRRDRLGRELVRVIEHTERETAGGSRMTLQLAVDYSARESIMRAVEESAAEARVEPESAGERLSRFAARIANAIRSPISDSRVDLLIRTGGERRLSDFLLWESAYAELVFVEECWPDFNEAGFNAALEEFRRRERRFGGLPGAEAPRAVGEAL